MNLQKKKCYACPVRGYSTDYCKFHREKISKLDVENCTQQSFYKAVGKTAAMGAGVGVVAATVGIAAIPAFGVKVAIGHALTAKITAGTGAAGAGLNTIRRPKASRSTLKKGKKRNVVLPMYLGKGN